MIDSDTNGRLQSLRSAYLEYLSLESYVSGIEDGYEDYGLQENIKYLKRKIYFSVDYFMNEERFGCLQFLEPQIRTGVLWVYAKYKLKEAREISASENKEDDEEKI